MQGQWGRWRQCRDPDCTRGELMLCAAGAEHGSPAGRKAKALRQSRESRRRPRRRGGGGCVMEENCTQSCCFAQRLQLFLRVPPWPLLSFHPGPSYPSSLTLSSGGCTVLPPVTRQTPFIWSRATKGSRCVSGPGEFLVLGDTVDHCLSETLTLVCGPPPSHGFFFSALKRDLFSI